MPRLKSVENTIYDAVHAATAAINALIKTCEAVQDAADSQNHYALERQMEENIKHLANVEEYDESDYNELVDVLIDTPVTYRFYESLNANDILTCRQRAENVVWAIEASIVVINKMAKKEEYADMDVEGYVHMIQRIMDSADDCTFPEKLK